MPTLISFYKHQQLKESDLLKLFKCGKLYLKIRKSNKFYDIETWRNEEEYIIIDRYPTEFIKDGKKLKYHKIQDGFPSTRIEVNLRLEECYDNFIKKVTL